jgi:DNA-binding MarR family transcriptional regulator
MTGSPKLKAKPAEIPVPDDQVETLLTLSRALVGLTARSLSELDDRLTLIQFRALVLLNDAGTMKASELGAGLDVGGSAVTRLCDRLVDEGLIHRWPNPHSRREVLLTPSDEARSLVKKVLDRRSRDLRRILSALKPSDRAPVASAMKKLAQSVESIHGDRVHVGWPLA